MSSDCKMNFKMTNLRFRKAGKDDKDDLLRWRNDPITRENSFNTKIITREEHERWFNVILDSEEKMLYIIENENDEKIGQVRFDKLEDDNFEINIAIAPEHRSKGYGKKSIADARELAFRDLKAKKIIAYIKPQNKISMIVFEKSNFKITERTDEKVTMILEK